MLCADMRVCISDDEMVRAHARTHARTRALLPSAVSEGSAQALGEKSLANLDQKLIDLIENEIMDHNPGITFDDIAGLDYVRNVISPACC